MKHTSSVAVWIGAGVLLLAVLGLYYYTDTGTGSAYGLRAASDGENTESYIRKEIILCLRSGEAGWRGRCFRELGGLLSSQFELETSLRTLAVLDDEEGIKQQCHALVHYLGQNEYEVTKSLSQTFGHCRASPTACGEGCFHGAVEGYIGEHGLSLAPQSIADICSRDFAPNEVTYRACTHGLGHAFMLLNGSDIVPSLDSCSHLEGAKDRESCYDGVFMENVFGFGSPDHPSLFIRPEEPTYPCTEVGDAYKNSCYGSQAVFVLEQGRSDFGAAAAFCAKVPSPYQKTCFGSLGGSAVVHFSEPHSVRNVCDVVPEGSFREQCLSEALLAVGYQFAGDAEKLGELCFAVHEEDRHQCLLSAGEVLESWFPGERPAHCELISAKGTEAYTFCTS